MTSGSPERGAVDSVVPVHWHLNPFVKLENHHGILQIAVLTHVHTHVYVLTNKQQNLQPGKQK